MTLKSFLFYVLSTDNSRKFQCKKMFGYFPDCADCSKFYICSFFVG